MIDKAKIESVATEMYSRHCKKGSPAKMLSKIISAEKIKLREIDGSENFLGAFFKQLNGQLYISVNKNIENTGRKNFTLAHELGHFALQHYLHTASFFCGENEITEENKAISDQEKEANYFASCFLLPKEKIKKNFIGKLQWRTKDFKREFLTVLPRGKSYSDWKAISTGLMEKFEISEIVLKIRLTELGLAKFDF
ncbi:MAG: ImmA/IrrE family metallo-endopeptidase [Lentimicrobiaceae bacterium]|nr:ImmA/IrrE family metallo-endopeptidase [Lentimicrobiaceae bacterium]